GGTCVHHYVGEREAHARVQVVGYAVHVGVARGPVFTIGLDAGGIAVAVVIGVDVIRLAVPVRVHVDPTRPLVTRGDAIGVVIGIQVVRDVVGPRDARIVGIAITIGIGLLLRGGQAIAVVVGI